MISYKFCITKFNVSVLEQGTKWVIRDISWIYSGCSREGIYASVEGTTPIPFDPDTETFVPVGDVTADMLCTWLLDALGSSFLRHLRDSVDGTIERNARITNQQMIMQTWLPLASPGATTVPQEVLDAYLSR